MHTTPRTARTSTPTQFSATFENQGSGTIYNTKYMLVIGKKNTIPEMQLIEYSAQSNDLAAPLKCRQLHVQRDNQRQHSFQLPLKTKVLARFTTLNTCSLLGRNRECETASQWKTRFEPNPTFLKQCL